MEEISTAESITARLIQAGEEGVVEVVIPPPLVQRAYSRVAKEVSKRMEIPGFRRGHAPPGIVMSHFGREKFQAWVAETLVQEYWPVILEQTHIYSRQDEDEGESSLRIEVRQLEPGREGVLLLKGPMAQVHVADLQQFEQSYQVPPVEEKEVDEAFEKILLDASTITLSASTSVRTGNVVLAEVRIAHRGKVVVGEEEPVRVTLEVGKHQYIPDLDPLLVGMERGAAKTALVAYPDDSPHEELRGQQVEVTVKVVDIFDIQRPFLTEEFLKAHFGGATNLEEARQNLRESLEQRQEEAAISRARQELLERVLQASHIVVPQREVEEKVREEMERLQEQWRQRGTSFLGDLRELEARVREAVEHRLRREYLLDYIADRERLRPSPEDLVETVLAYSEATGINSEDLLRLFQENESLRRWFHRQALRRLAMDFIAEQGSFYRASEDQTEGTQDSS